jgi:hypothetical protein
MALLDCRRRLISGSAEIAVILAISAMQSVTNACARIPAEILAH